MWTCRSLLESQSILTAIAELKTDFLVESGRFKFATRCLPLLLLLLLLLQGGEDDWAFEGVPLLLLQFAHTAVLHKVANQALAALRHNLLVLLPELLDHGVLRIERGNPVHRGEALPGALVGLATIGLRAGDAPPLLLIVRTARFELTCGSRLLIHILRLRRLLLDHKLVHL